MSNWIQLTNESYNDVWDRFYKEFSFKPSIHKEDWPTFKVKIPHITYDISVIWRCGSFERYEYIYKDLHEKILYSFIKCTHENERVYALNWQHTSYTFNPRLKMETKIFEFADGEKIERWNIEVLPNGDYYIFLANDFSWGLLGHPWEKSICVLGNELIKSIAGNCPILFEKIITKAI